ncbi:hypothetical protein JCM3770_001010 [Rhodotorula araucariae]
MNTLSFFLTTLRPAPPPSPCASTSELPISAALSPAAASADEAEASISEQMDDIEADEAERREEAVAKPDERRPPFAHDHARVGMIPPSRGPSRKGKARDAGSPAAGGRVAAVEVPLRDGVTVKTELERDEGVESEIVQDAPSHHSAPSYNGTLAVRDPEKGAAAELATAALPAGPVGNSSAWPWMARLVRWWPFRLTATLYVLVRRFLSLFGLSYSPRPSFNALLAPAPAALSSEEGDADDLDEKGVPSKRHARLVSLALAISQRPRPPTTRTRSSFSPSPSPSPTPLSIPRAPLPAPKLTPKTLVLDLDETLIHSTSRSGGGLGKRGAPKGLKTRVVEVVLDGRSTVYTVYKRPWVDFFLRKVSSWYTVVIFTASLPEYADPVIDWLDGGDGHGGMVGARLFRAEQDCMARNGSYVKDLSVVDADLSRVCLVDNSPASYAVNQANGIPIEGWINDPHDECLLDLLPMLDSLRFTNDVRRVLGLRGFGRREAGPPRTGGGHTATFFGGHAPPFHSWRDEKLLWSSHSPSSPLLKAHNVSLAPRVRRPLPAAPSHPAAPVQRMPDSDASSRSTRVRSLEGAFQSGLTGPSTMSFSPSPIPDSPRAAPTVAKHGTREFSLLAHPVPPPLPPARAAACGQRIVWLGPLPADLAPAELAAILDGYDVAQYAMHPVNQATHAGAVALEVEAKSAEGAEELQADVRGGMIPLRGAAVDVYACNPRQELIGEVGRARPEQEKRATGAFADKRLVTNATVAPDSTWTASEADGNSGFSPMEGVAAEEEQCEPGVIAATLTSTHVASNLAWHMPLSLRGGSSLADPSCSLSPSVSLPTRLAETHLPSTAQPSALLQTGSTPPSPTLPPSRRSFSPSHAPTPPGRAHYTIHPTRARSPYPRSPSPGADDLYATREAEIEDEMRCEVVDALEERKVRDEWETRERWYARWERVEVIDLTSDEGDEEAMAVDA